MLRPFCARPAHNFEHRLSTQSNTPTSFAIFPRKHMKPAFPIRRTEIGPQHKQTLRQPESSRRPERGNEAQRGCLFITIFRSWILRSTSPLLTQNSLSLSLCVCVCACARGLDLVYRKAFFCNEFSPSQRPCIKLASAGCTPPFGGGKSLHMHGVLECISVTVCLCVR